MILDPDSKKKLYQQVFDQVHGSIETGSYKAGMKLPPIRSLAAELGCSRNTVETAYRMLVQEGFIISKPGSGYIVQDVDLLHADPEFCSQAGDALVTGAIGSNRRANGEDDDADADATTDAGVDAYRNDRMHYGNHTHCDNHERCDIPCALNEHNDIRSGKNAIRYDFTYGNLQHGTFPATAWKVITNEILSSPERFLADVYSDPLGEMELRGEIARQLNASRRIPCFPEQIIIQSGTEASVSNLLALFNHDRDSIAIEDPGYDAIREAFIRSGFAVTPIPVEKGTQAFLSAIENSDAKLAYVTPSSQFPTCQIMSLEVRKRLIEWAQRKDAYILEDDYCREFRYREKPAPPLASMTTGLNSENVATVAGGRVIYMGTFSKSLSPALRLNYLVLPPQLLKRWKKTFQCSYPTVPWLSQAVLARFMRSGQWDRHVRRMQATNRRKYEAVCRAIRMHMGQRVTMRESGTGLHLLIDVQDNRSQDELIDLAAQSGVRVYGTSEYYTNAQPNTHGCILIGFSAIQEEDIESGIKTLSTAWFD